MNEVQVSFYCIRIKLPSHLWFLAVKRSHPLCLCLRLCLLTTSQSAVEGFTNGHTQKTANQNSRGPFFRMDGRLGKQHLKD
ncbi:hypothetical protein ACHQM5_003517 [Ranunculus cassubicifolius]